MQPPLNHLERTTKEITNTKTNISNGSSKDVNNGYKSVGEWGQYTILEKDGKKYQKHKWKDEPMKEYDESNT